MTHAQKFLDSLNTQYLTLHSTYENLFWTSYMGDHTVDAKKDKALTALDAFRGDKTLSEKALQLRKGASKKDAERLMVWIAFFDQYQMSDEAKAIKANIDALESAIGVKRATRTEGYIDPVTKKFVPASSLKMRTLISTSPDEAVRKACYEAREKMALDCLSEYVELVALRNSFAHAQGYTDFYDYNLRAIDRMTKKELFTLFDDIHTKTKSNFTQIRTLEKKKKGLRKPWNFGYYMSGDFTKEEDPYFQFDQALTRWGRSFSALGIDFKGGSLTLDLLDRQGKYNNGFCHWPIPVHYRNGKRIPSSANFTCNVVAGQVGSGIAGYKTLFHEGGHAAHLANAEQRDACLNQEYAPMTASWAETQSMFLDTLFDSIEWKMRYAKNTHGEAYPFDLFVKKVEALAVLRPAHILSVAFVASFERDVYELKVPTAKKILAIARKNHRTYFDMSEHSLGALNIPHIYSWESACSYHGYGLAMMALSQWREYFYKKYGYIVDNPQVGREMSKVWKLGASKSFTECVQLATGRKLSSRALIQEIVMSPKHTRALAKKRLTRMESVRQSTKPVQMHAHITMVHGKKKIAQNSKSFEKMALIYERWVQKMTRDNS